MKLSTFFSLVLLSIAATSTMQGAAKIKAEPRTYSEIKNEKLRRCLASLQRKAGSTVPRTQLTQIALLADALLTEQLETNTYNADVFNKQSKITQKHIQQLFDHLKQALLQLDATRKENERLQKIIAEQKETNEQLESTINLYSRLINSKSS